ncbi:MAG: ABC transporter substrate-binding protein [Leptospira sp.]|nr:ABC transporter substrate-binding protein [Leptospira sp.]
MKNTRLVLDFYHPWPNSIGFYNARKQGYIEGLKIKIYDPFYGDSLDHLLQGEADIAISYPNRFLDRVCNGSDLVALFPLVVKPLESLYYEGEKKENIFRDLQSARVGYRKSPRLKAILEDLNNKHFSENPMKLVEIYPEEPMPEDLGRRLDFCFGALYAWEGLFSGSKIISSHSFSDLGIVSYPGQILVTTREFFNKNKTEIYPWMNGIKKGYLNARSNLTESADLIHEFIPYFPKNIVHRSLEILMDYFPNEDTWGLWNWMALEEYKDFLLKNKLLNKNLELRKYFL